MPNIKSAKKRVIVAETRRARNMAAKAAMKTQLKKFAAAVEDGDKSAAERELLASVSILDKTASKGVIHKKCRRKTEIQSLSGL